MHVLRNVHRALVAGGRALDVHPVGTDIAVRAGSRGLGFVDRWTDLVYRKEPA